MPQEVPAMPYAFVVVIILIIDQLTKLWINSSLEVGAASPLIPGFIQLTNVQNTGAAFGLLSNVELARWFFVVLTIAVSIGVVVLLSKDIIKGKLGRWMLVLVIAGGLGNCIDRIFNGYVVDMFQFQFKIFGQDFAIFNVADIFITVSGIIFCIYLILHKEPEEEPLPVRAPSRSTQKETERPVRADYITQLKKPVVEGRKNIEAELAAKTIEASPFRSPSEALPLRKDEVTITDWNMPDFAAADKKAPEASPAASQKPEIVNPFKLETAPDSKLARLEELIKEPVAPSKKNDSEFSIEDIIAEFKDK